MKWTKNEDLTRYGIELTSDSKKIPLGNTNKDYQIYKIPLDKLKYNSSNGRIYMELKKLITENDIDLVNLELNNVEEFNKEIENLIWESSVEKNEDTMEDIGKYTQLESGVVLDDGTIIDGNRRFTCLRRLHEKYPENEDYKFFKAAIIFMDGTVSKKDIKAYELRVQFGRDEKVDYKAVNFAMSIYNEIKNDQFTIQEIAQEVKKTPGDITKIVHTCELIEDFLKYVNQKDQLYIAEVLNVYWPFEPLGAYLHSKDGLKLPQLEKEKRKHLFYDYLLSLDLSLPTQELRDNLIKLIYKDEILWNELSQEYEDSSCQSVTENLINNNDTPEAFVDRVKEFRKSETSQHINAQYKKIVEKKKLQEQANAPVLLCDEVLEKIKSIDISAFLAANSSTADSKLIEMRGKLKESYSLIKDILDLIISKVGDNE